MTKEEKEKAVDDFKKACEELHKPLNIPNEKKSFTFKAD
jgi:hypothetical protein